MSTSKNNYSRNPYPKDHPPVNADRTANGKKATARNGQAAGGKKPVVRNARPADRRDQNRYARDYMYASRGMRERENRRKGRFAAFVISAVLLVVMIVIVRNSIINWQTERTLQEDLAAHANTFEPNVSINGIELTGYSYDDAYAMLNERYAANLSKQVLLVFGDKSWTFTPAQVGAKIDLEQQIQTAWAYGKTGTELERQAQIHTLRENPVELSAELTFDIAALEAFVEEIRLAIDCDPINATRRVVDIEKFEFTDSSVGYRLDGNVLEAQLEDIILNGGADRIELQVEVLEPSPSRAELEAATVLLGECTTSLETSSSKRDYNVNLALGLFNFMVVEPDETISFNKVVGKRTKKNGFYEAPEYAGTTVTTGIGGGVCQASTTLYGAVIRAGLQVVERHAHTMTVGYVEASQDAAVNNDDKNLRFKNNTGDQIFIFAWTDDRKETATVKIYGKPVDSTTRIEILSDVTQRDIKGGSITYMDDTEGKRVWYVDDPPVLVEAGKPGMRSTAYRIYYDLTTGQEVKREKLSSDYYAPQNDIYLRGVHERG